MAALKGVKEAKRKLKQLNRIVPLSMFLAANAKACAELSERGKDKG